jgi:hypothetical protein
MKNQETTPCKYCGKPTPMLGTKLCDPCWELEKRIGISPEVAREILMEAMEAICKLKDESKEAREIIRSLLADLSPHTREQVIRREQAIFFLKKNKQQSQED